jgi:hypothetical protein
VSLHDPRRDNYISSTWTESKDVKEDVEVHLPMTAFGAKLKQPTRDMDKEDIEVVEGSMQPKHCKYIASTRIVLR